MEQAGRWGVVSWTDHDILNALESAGADPTPENIRAVREHVHVQHIADRMTETGWTFIDETIRELGLVLPIRPGEKGE